MMKFILVIIANIRHILKKNKADNIPAISGYSALFVILSFVPIIMFVIAIVSIFNGDPAQIRKLEYQTVSQNVVASMIKTVIDNASESASGVAVVTGILSLWSAGKGLYSIADGISRIYRLEDKRPWFVRRIFSMGYTLVMLLTVVLASAGFVALRYIDSIIQPYIKSLPFAVGIIYAMRYVFYFLIIVLLISLALKLFLRSRVKEKRFADFRVQIPGALFTTACWMGFSWGFDVYVNSFNGFSIYGGVASVAVVMIWMYFMMYILLLGVQLNYVYRLQIYVRFTLKGLFRKKRKKQKSLQ